jgi:hypothetical protein
VGDFFLVETGMKGNGVSQMSQQLSVRIIAAVLCFALHGGLDATRVKTRAEQPVKDRVARLGNIRAGRVLFLGNSITLHGPSAGVSWSGNWGMAASEREKDYAHVLVNSIAAKLGRRPETMIDNIADFERHYDTYDVDSRLKEHLAFKADLVVVAIGENVPALASEQSRAAFKKGLAGLLKTLKINSNPTIVVRSCFWRDKTKDEILKQACTDVGGVFVDIGELGKDESNYARSERSYAHAGVAAHPGDKGMKAIADAILGALKR